MTVQSGGALSVGQFRVANGNLHTGSSSVTIQNGGSIAVTGGSGSQIGVQSNGSLTIESGASFNVSADVRVGNWKTNEFQEGNGTLTNRGTLTASTLILSENMGSGYFIHQGAAATTAAALLMMPYNTANVWGAGTSVLEVHGSGGTIQFTNDNTALTANDASNTLGWILDAGGATTIELTGANSSASIVGANLALDIDAYSGEDQKANRSQRRKFRCQQCR